MTTKAPTYQLSKDYEALYDHLCAGGEALGMRYSLKTGEAKECPLRLSVATDGSFIFQQGWDAIPLQYSKSQFIAECQRLSLEWLPPHPPEVVPTVMTDPKIAEYITFIRESLYDISHNHPEIGVAMRNLDALEQCIAEALSPLPEVVGQPTGEEPYKIHEPLSRKGQWQVTGPGLGGGRCFDKYGECLDFVLPLNAAFQAGRSSPYLSKEDRSQEGVGNTATTDTIQQENQAPKP